MSLIWTVSLVVLIVVALFLFALKFVVRCSIKVKGGTNIPGIGFSLPIVGDAWRFAGVTNMTELMNVVDHLVAGCDLKSLWLGQKLIVVVQDPKIGEVVLNSSKSADKDSDVYVEFNNFTDGVFSRRNCKGWKDMRRPLGRMLQHQNVWEKFYPVFADKSEELSDIFNSISGKDIPNILDHIQGCIMDVVHETLFGIPGMSKEPNPFDPNSIARMTAVCMKLIVNPLYRLARFVRVPSVMKEIGYIRGHYNKLGKKIQEVRGKELEEDSVDPDEPDFEIQNYSDVILSLRNREPKKNEYHVNTKPMDVVVAGFDTSSVGLASAVLFLAMHPDIQQKAYEEQIQIMGDSLRPPTPEEISRMEYLDRFHQETVRHVGVPGVFRTVTSELKVGDAIFPEGCSVYVSIHKFNINPEYWEKPNEFYPEHFLPENIAKRPKYSWMPFSTGARSCPGKTFASVSTKVFLSTLLRRFTLTTPMKFEEIEYEYMLMLKSAKGYPVRIERRCVSAA